MSHTEVSGGVLEGIERRESKHYAESWNGLPGEVRASMRCDEHDRNAEHLLYGEPVTLEAFADEAVARIQRHRKMTKKALSGECAFSKN